MEEIEDTEPAEVLTAVSAEELLPAEPAAPEPAPAAETEIKAVLEAIIYITEEPLTKAQIAASIGQPPELVEKLLAELTAEYERPEHGLTIREVAGGYKMGTKAEHHEAVRAVRQEPEAALEALPLAGARASLAVIAYKQPITGPEVMEIRGVQGASVLKTLLERKPIAAAGRKAGDRASRCCIRRRRGVSDPVRAEGCGGAAVAAQGV